MILGQIMPGNLAVSVVTQPFQWIYSPPKMENQVEQKMDNEMETV